MANVTMQNIKIESKTAFTLVHGQRKLLKFEGNLANEFSKYIQEGMMVFSPFNCFDPIELTMEVF